MISSNNVLRSVQTYNPIHLAWFQNQNCFVSDICNHEYNEFLSKNEANLGDTLSIATESSFIAGRGLDAKVQPFVQNIYHISVNQSAGVWAASDVQQQMFNLDKNDYLKNNAGKNMIATLGSFVEQQIAKEAISDSRDYRVGSPTYGQANVNSGPTSFVDFTGGLSSYQQLDQSQQDWIITGAPLTGHKVILPGNYYSPIIGSGLTQFVPKRNEEAAASWMVGKFGTPETTYYKSNALPNHISGTLGQAQTTCTVVSVNDTTGNNVTQIVLSGAGTDLNALKAGDMGYFITSTSGVPYKTTHVGHMDTDQVAQFRVIADAPSSGGFVTCNLVVGTYTEGQGFCSNPANGLQNINTAIVAGMKVLFVPSHKAGLRVAGDGFYCLIPKLKMKTPWHCAVDTDPETKVSLRMYYGDYLDKDQQLFANDVIFGTLCLPMRSQRILLPLNGNIVTP